MEEVLADLPGEVADLVTRAPSAEAKKLLELRFTWMGLADAEARVADRLRVFLLTWDPLGWTAPDRGMAWATANGDGDDFEVVLYALLDAALDRARSRETSLPEVLAYEAESALAVAARYELSVRYGAYPSEVAARHVPSLLSEPPETARRALPEIAAVAGEWEPIGLAVIQDLVQEAVGRVDLDRTSVVLSERPVRDSGCPACAGRRFGFIADLQEHRASMCAAHDREAQHVTRERIDRARRSNPRGWSLMAEASDRLSRPELPLALTERLHGVLDAWGRNERTDEQFRESAAVVEALHIQFKGDTETFEDLLVTGDWSWDVDTWLMELAFALASAGYADLAVATADRLAELQPDSASMHVCDAMVILAESGRADEARSRAEAAVAAWPDDPWVHAKAGDVHAALDDADRAEQAYRRAIEVAHATGDHDVEFVGDRLVNLLADQPGREAEAKAVHAETRKAARRRRGASGEPVRRAGPKIGRNDPCPCGSGKKYKRCCGA
jgi:tetratricopeptide (TPR) repeat protein